MDINELRQNISKVVELLNAEYEQHISEPVEVTGNANFSNFLRNGPNRKVVLFNYSYGDYVYEDSMFQNVEVSLCLDNAAIYSIALNLLTKEFGAPLSSSTGNYDQLPFRRIQIDEAAEIRDINWTPEYEGGALFENADSFAFESASFAFEYWKENNQHVVLQSGKTWGDGDFTFYVLVAISKL